MASRLTWSKIQNVLEISNSLANKILVFIKLQLIGNLDANWIRSSSSLFERALKIFFSKGNQTCDCGWEKTRSNFEKFVKAIVWARNLEHTFVWVC